MKTLTCGWIAVASGVLMAGMCLAAERSEGPSPAEWTERMAAAPASLRTLAAQLATLEKEWQAVLDALAGKSYKQISSAETDRIESLLFRFLVCREALWDMLTLFSEGEQGSASEEDQTRAFATAFHAAALLSRHTSWLVLNAMDAKVLVRKLNEAHYRYDIPAGTFDMLFYALTSPKHLNELNEAKRSFAFEATVADSTLSRMMAADPALAAQLAQTAWLWIQADEMTKDILKRRSIVLPDVANRLRQNELMAQARKAHRQMGANLYVAQGLLYNTISDFKRPMTRHLMFTAEQAVIEAVAEGVIFNSTDVIMRNHVNRMLVLRPKVSQEDRTQALVNTFLLLGCQYDFNFDFVDASYQCCTEVIYRSFDKRGGLAFNLVPRAGVQTLAADDIVNYYLGANPDAFEFVLLAEENPGGKAGQARVLAGDAGLNRLKGLMQQKSEEGARFTLPKFKPAFPNLLPSKLR